MKPLPVIDLKATGENIRCLRAEAKLSVSQLQHIFGFASTQAIYKWQRGDSLPTLDNMAVLAAVLNVSIDEIIRYK